MGKIYGEGILKIVESAMLDMQVIIPNVLSVIELTLIVWFVIFKKRLFERQKTGGKVDPEI